MASVFKKGMKSRGILYGVGIGPGDPELLTIKGRNILKKADVVFAPKAGIKSASLAAEIIKKYIPRDKIKTIVFPMSKDKKTLETFWRRAALKVHRELCPGKTIVFITIGDPLIYSTYMYLLRYLYKVDKNIDIRTIPGISVVNAVASAFSVPLAEANERLAVIPLPGKLTDLKKFLKQFDTVVLLKIGKDLNRLVRFLKKEKFKGSFYFAKWLGRQKQYIVDDISKLNNSKKALGYMSTILLRRRKR